MAIACEAGAYGRVTTLERSRRSPPLVHCGEKEPDGLQFSGTHGTDNDEQGHDDQKM